jgi:hypothetical protein
MTWEALAHDFQLESTAAAWVAFQGMCLGVPRLS